MNEAHRAFHASPAWRQMLEDDYLPWLQAFELGDDVLEVGAGPGLATDLLRRLAPKVTALELDPGLAEQLRQRMAGTGVDVVEADATSIPLPDARFSTVAVLSMLHHVPTPAQQDAVLAEAHRVLRDGGRCIGVDARDLDALRPFHADDTFLPIAPDDLRHRLQQVGFVDVDLEICEFEVRFSARKP